MMDFTPRCHIEKEFEKVKVKDIIKEVDDDNASLVMCLKACKALATITAIALQTRNADLLVDCLDEGACELLVMALNKYALINSELCSYACQTICNMSYCSRELQEFLGEIGACELVVYACSMHIGDPNVSEYGSSAICLLANNNISNSYRLAEVDACECMAQIGNFGFNIQNERSSIVASNVCLAFTHLCEAANANKLYECGANELVINLLKTHKNNSAFIPSGVKSLCSLASLNSQHRSVLGNIGACQLIIQILLKEEKPYVIQDCCECIMHLTLDINNNKSFSEMIYDTNKYNCLSLCQLLLLCLDRYLMRQEFGSEICTGALLNLVTINESKYIDKNKEYIIINNGVSILKESQHSIKCSYRAKENILQLLAILGVENDILGIGSVTSTSTTANQSFDSNISQNIQPIHTNNAIEKSLDYIEFRRMTSYGSLDNEIQSNAKYNRLIQRKKSLRKDTFSNQTFEI